MRAICGMNPIEPENGGTYVTHHMVFETQFVEELLNLMKETTGSSKPWPKLLMSFSRKYYRFSEYKTYATFMVNKHANRFNHHPLPIFGDGGLRFREANCIVDEILRHHKVNFGGLSYPQVREFVMQNWRMLSSPGNILPAYIQLDHVYGLYGFD